MKTTTIEFNQTSADLPTCASPWASSGKGTYQDKILKPEFVAHRYKFPVGTTWFRVVPALKNSNKDWMLGIHALDYSGGRHAHPKTLIPGTKSVFDHAYGWCKENRRESLYSKANKEGFRLLADPICLFWMLTEIDGKPVARLVLESGYDGSRGGTPGLGHQIWRLSQERDEEGNRIGNPADPEIGTQICVEKKQVPGTRYSSYSLKMGRVPVPISEMLGKMDTDKTAVLTSLEEVIHIPSEEEEWKLLENVIDPETIREIRQSID
jgi:hypothetical protein